MQKKIAYRIILDSSIVTLSRTNYHKEYSCLIVKDYYYNYLYKYFSVKFRVLINSIFLFKKSINLSYIFTSKLINFVNNL